MKLNIASPTRVIMLGFLLSAIIGSVLLCLPVCHNPGADIDYIDALFVSVSAVCVTGLSTVNIAATFSGLGQVVLLFLVQLGGLGIVTFSTLILILFRKRITLSDRMLIQSAYNIETLAGLVKTTIRIIKLSVCIELFGAVMYSFVFVPEYGALGIWYSLFTAVSAFCNAGLDLFGANSICAYRDNVLINFTTIILIISGGLGFPVFWEIGGAIKARLENRRKKMNFHAVLVIWITVALLLAGTIITLVFEYNNPLTLGGLEFPQKLMASFFQSVTLRTAGFATIDQANFNSSSCILYMILMLIGGSPSGTAGGVKTVTVFVLFASVVANIKGKREVSILKRRITDTVVRRCVAIVAFSVVIMVVLTTLLMVVQELDFLDSLYEMTSAIATVGLSRGITGSLNPVSKIIVIIAMYLGRIGPITLALAFNTHKSESPVLHAEGKVLIG